MYFFLPISISNGHSKIVNVQSVQGCVIASVFMLVCLCGCLCVRMHNMRV
jgi:hypothetical protein